MTMYNINHKHFVTHEKHNKVKSKIAAWVTHFIDVVHLDDVVEEAVEVVEERHHFHRRADGAHGREAHDVGEEDGHRLVALRLHGHPRHQLIRDVPATDEAAAPTRWGTQSRTLVSTAAAAVTQSEWVHPLGCSYIWHLGSMLERSLSARIFSAVNWLVLSSTTSSKWFAYFSSFATILSSIFAWLQYRKSWLS